MSSSTVLSLQSAQKIIDTSLTKGHELKLKPLTVVVLDTSGAIKACAREDNATSLRPDIAMGKASGALSMGVSSRALGEMSQARPQFFSALVATSQGQMIPAAGGVLIRSGDLVIGAVGITGDTSDNDEACAIAGIEAAGFQAG
ncbi:MAG: hypothetical protein DHS20C01_20580 [marine bacterium B5-7]|nr:MAG: hypothetical protein DHS20C01_20580 [marine bacterium B5-7]